MGDPTRTVTEALQLHDHVDRRGDLLTNRPHRKVVAGHEDQRLESAEGVARVVCVQGGERAVVARVHRLQHVKGLTRPALADHDAVRTHPKRVLDQVANADLTLAFHVRRPGLEREHVILVELQLLGVLDRDDSFVGRNEGRQHVQHRRLTGSGTTRDDHVELADDAGLQEASRVDRQRAEADEVIDSQRVGGELPNGEEGAAHGQRSDDGVDTGSVGQAGVTERRRLVDPAADLGHDLVDDATEVGFVHESDFIEDELAAPLDVDHLRAVAHDLGDIIVSEQLVDRAIAEDVIGDVLDELCLVGRRQRRPLHGDRPVQGLVHLLAKVILTETLVVEDRAQLFDERAVDSMAELDVRGVVSDCQRRRRCRRTIPIFMQSLVQRHSLPPLLFKNQRIGADPMRFRRLGKRLLRRGTALPTSRTLSPRSICWPTAPQGCPC